MFFIEKFPSSLSGPSAAAIFAVLLLAGVPVRAEEGEHPEFGTRTAVLMDPDPAGGIQELFWDRLGMDADAAQATAERLWAGHVARERPARAAELETGAITLGEHTLRLLRATYGTPGENGPSLWISLHGGGGAPAQINDRQWRNQLRLYQPEEGLYLAPRAPSNEWNLWHRPEVDALFDHLIESAVIVWGVDPDRVYLLGYSAGGDGVYQLAPRMADRFAAASMMAGHPNDATPAGLRNLPFGLFMGGDDAAHNRNGVAREWEIKLRDLHTEDPDGYKHLVRIYPGVGHWMELRDAKALPWMSGHTRNPWPARVVWRQGNTPHTRFYWLAVAEEHAVRGREIRAEVDGQTITLSSQDVPRVELLLHDTLLNLDAPVRVVANEKTVFEGMLPRTEAAMRRSLHLRGDRRMLASAWLTVEIKAER